MTGDIVASGKISATEVVTNIVSQSVSFATGSTRFGDEQTDSHTFTGSLNVSGSATFMTAPTRGVIIDNVSGFGRIGSTNSSFFIGGGNTSEIQIQSNFIPDGDSVRRLGASNRFFSELYVDEATIGNDTNIKTHANDSLSVPEHHWSSSRHPPSDHWKSSRHLCSDQAPAI